MVSTKFIFTSTKLIDNDKTLLCCVLNNVGSLFHLGHESRRVQLYAVIIANPAQQLQCRVKEHINLV